MNKSFAIHVLSCPHMYVYDFHIREWSGKEHRWAGGARDSGTSQQRERVSGLMVCVLMV